NMANSMPKCSLGILPGPIPAKLQMDPPLRIAFFLGMFPVISETFILRQITGLLALGHHVDVYADSPSPDDALHQPEVDDCRLRDPPSFLAMPPASAPCELPIWPLTGETWIPGAAKAIPNSLRAARAVPVLLRALMVEPRLAVQSLRQAEYGFQAHSLSVL